MTSPIEHAKSRRQTPVRKLLRPFHDFVQHSASGGIVLMAATLIALLLANTPLAEAYHDLLHIEIGLTIGRFGLHYSLLHWINDGLMTIFFLLVGLEIKREVLIGELSSVRAALLPLVAALGGAVVPAVLYALLNRGGVGAAGWGIPMATDIAFTLGLLALLGDRVPLALKVFVTAAAIVDDLIAILVIALFYSSGVNMIALGAGLSVLTLMVVGNRLGVHRLAFYLLLGVLVWLAFLESGIHATIAGVLIALTIPAGKRADAASDAIHDRTLSPLQRLEHALQPWIAFAIMPIFALANAGITLSLSSLQGETMTVALGVIVGLVIGKPLGILGASWLVIRSGVSRLPQQVRWAHLIGAACLAGIGFTMSLFIAALGLDNGNLLEVAKLGILSASLIAGVIGFVLLRRVRIQTAPSD